MAWSLTAYSLLGFGAAGVSAVVASRAWRDQTQRGARQFVWLMVALGGWSLVYAVQLGFGTPTAQLLWQQLSLAVGGTVPTLWLLFVLHYTGRAAWLTRGRRLALAVDPVAFALLTVTNPFHGLVWDGAALVSTPAGPALDLLFAVGYYIHIVYAYAAVTVGLGLLALVFERTAPTYRRQTGLLILGVAPPFLANIAYTLRISWGPLPAVDPTPFVFVLTGVLWALALYQFDLLRRAPLARRRTIDQMGDGLVVLDVNGQVVNANPVAREALDPSPVAGRSIEEVVPDEVTGVDAARNALDGQTLTASVDGRQRAYDLDWSTLTDEEEGVVGYTVTLRDVTERNEYEQRLEVAQRVLRHNLRNDMNVIQGCADHIAETATDDHATTARRIRDTADRLVDLSEKTRTMTRMRPSASPGQTSVDVATCLDVLTGEFADAYPDATVECTVTEPVSAGLPDSKFLRIPVENVVENAIEHNGTDSPWVRVSAESTGDRVSVCVEDDGPHIPEMERATLAEGTEDPLRHGSGLGLWLTYWSVNSVGGSVSFETPPSGNVVTLEFPAAG